MKLTFTLTRRQGQGYYVLTNATPVTSSKFLTVHRDPTNRSEATNTGEDVIEKGIDDKFTPKQFDEIAGDAYYIVTVKA